MPAAGYAVINWEAPSVEFSCKSESTQEVSVSWIWEGPNYNYRVYRQTNPTGEFTLLGEEIDAGNPTTYTLVDASSELVSGETYHYQVRVVYNDQEFPSPYTTSVKVM